MRDPDVIQDVEDPVTCSAEEARERAVAEIPNGARFYRCALQVNPRHYAETFRGGRSDATDEGYAEALAAKAADLGIEVLAVSDHNNADGVGTIREAASRHGIVVFPGFELSSSEGVHVLCIYPLSTGEGQLKHYLGEFGIRDTTATSALAKQTFRGVLETVADQGGVTIAAHVTSEKGGLLRVLSGTPRIEAWMDPKLLAVQIPGSVDGLPDDLRPIVTNKNADYRRAGAPEPDRLAVAVLNAKDIVKPDDLEESGASCLIKMSDVSLEGLRQAFLDPGSRIRLASDPDPEPHTELLSLEWTGGFLDGTRIRFNENLNVLIGGRGTGKSTVIESIRYVLGLEPAGEQARRSHSSFVKLVLGPAAKIVLMVRSHLPPSRKIYRLERIVPNPPVVRDEAGEVLQLSPQDVMPSVEVYGQHEISELARDEVLRTRLLDRFLADDTGLAKRKAGVAHDLEGSRTKLLEVRRELGRVEERLAALPALEERLKRYGEAGLEERLKDRSQLVREERVLDTAVERLQSVDEAMGELRRAVPIDRAFVSERALNGLPHRETLVEIDRILARLDEGLSGIVARADEVVAAATSALDVVRRNWNGTKDALEADFQKKLRELHAEGVDGQDFIRLRKEVETLRPMAERRTLLDRELKELQARRTSLLADWVDMKAGEARNYAKVAKRIGKRLSGRVHVRVTAEGDRTPLFDLVRSLGGQVQRSIDALRDVDHLSLGELAALCRQGERALQDRYGIPRANARNLADAPEEILLKIEELDLPPTTSLELNVAREGDSPEWRRIEALSTGQQATAVLLLLLLESDAPLVVDQPEDDLDNRFIREDIVPRMREEKRRRQFVLSTHNANIPVLGDAELILGLVVTNEDGQPRGTIPIELMGSIDRRPVRELVEEILEGGKEAFERRRAKYGF